MRLATFALILAAGLAAAGMASAQMGGWQGTQNYSIQGDSLGPYSIHNDHQPISRVQVRYNAKILALKAKMRTLTRQDGGQLSDEHKAGLQSQLDELNRSFGLKPGHS
jgi:hypothetical protein